MSDTRQALEKQARWQASRRGLSWPEKIRMAERVRDSVVSLRAWKATPIPQRQPAARPQ